MKYNITGKQIDIGESLQEHVRTELDAILEKYAGRPTGRHDHILAQRARACG